ncbi:sll1863 family stress response protein [Adhaeribacter pallidiroseus]|uniref:Uncharacterized protein n=1 Tax=Adhaeribacter pallidiroseus TaxID=2072847 RepID=A0A369QIY1_9BACT|nr:hypothetical protein [Adhaeribacter pallidiroseus]RDC62248.1 hypothetical protein AHMF7616_00839 [Adhaeribacter pallidiroseus]
MDHYPLKPENMRAPAHLTRDEIKQSLEELDNKIKVLQGRAHATTADSNHTYHKHIAGLEKKRALLVQQLDTTQDESSNTWTDIKNSLQSLKDEIRNMLD